MVLAGGRGTTELASGQDRVGNDRVQHFRQRLKNSGLVVRSFSTCEGLELEVFHALSELAGSGVRVSAGPTAVTQALPRDIGSFTGRGFELARLDAYAARATRDGGVVGICTIEGMAGVGKTAFAVHAAHLMARHFPDGQVFLPLHGHTPGQHPVDPSDALATLLQASGIPAQRLPDSTQARSLLWRDRLAGKRFLLVLDDAAGHQQVMPLLPGAAGSLVLITSRTHLSALDDAEAVSLDVLPAEDAAVLLARLAARADIRPGDAAVQQIIRLCGRLPLAVGMLARQLHHHPSWTPGEVAADLTAARDRLQLLRAGEVSVAAAFDLSYRDLTPGQQRLFRRLGLHPGADVDAYAAAAIDGTSLEAARGGLSDLYDHYLLTEPARGRYRMHDLVRGYARSLARDELPEEQDAAVTRLLGYYLHTARAAGRQFARRTPAGPPAVTCEKPAYAPDLAAGGDCAAWLAAEYANLVAAIRLATETGHVGYAVELPSALHGYFRHQGNWPQVIALYEVAVRTAEQAGSRQAEANALTDLADICYLLADYPAASSLLDTAITVHRSAGNHLGLANAMAILGYVRHLTGDHSAAGELLGNALRLYRRLGDRLGQAGALAYLSRGLLVQGQYEDAEAGLNQAIELYRGLGGIMEAGLLYYRGLALETAGDYRGATASIAQALELQRAAGNPHGQMEALTYLAIAQHDSGDLDAAAASLQEAVEFSRRLGILHGQVLALRPFDDARYTSGENARSAASLRHAADVYARLGLRRDAMGALNALGRKILQSDPVSAYQCHEGALVIAEEIGSPPHAADAHAGMSQCLIRQQRQDEAVIHLRQALAIYQQTGSPKAAATSTALQELENQRPYRNQRKSPH
jgi:tetratricopeptide (TPR) repeat protein